MKPRRRPLQGRPPSPRRESRPKFSSWLRKCHPSPVASRALLLPGWVSRAPRSEGGAEEIALVPRRDVGVFGNLIADQEVHDGTLGSGVEIHRLIHVVERRVVAGGKPFL